MGRVILCTGKRTKTPYYFAEPDIHVNCIEELCYMLLQNAFLLEGKWMTGELVEWIERECLLPQLSQKLYSYLNQKKTPEEFVAEILRYTGIYTEETIERTEEAIRMGANLSVYEKRKKRIDAMVEKEKYELALSEYDKLLAELPVSERAMSADLWHNRGVALTGLFAFAQAAKSFEISYELVPNEETCLQLLAARRMELPDTEYVAYVAQWKEQYPISMELERRIEEILHEYENDEKKAYLEQFFEWRKGEEAGQYYAQAEKIVRQLKEVYRSQAAE